MHRLLAIVALAALSVLCGCGNSSRVVSRTETTTVTEYTTMVPCKKSCGSGKCMRVAEPAGTASQPVTVKTVESGNVQDFAPASVVELPASDGAAAKGETPVPVSTTTTTRVVRWPRKLD